MQLDSIKLYNYRNLQIEGELEFSPGVNFFIGKNGQGKTNLLEAIYFLGSGRSFRSSKISELISWQRSEASVFGKVRRKTEDLDLGISISVGKRTAYCNSEQISSFSKYLGKLLTICFAPSDLELVQGAPAERRRFIDKHLSELSASYFDNLLAYQRALKSKNAILRAGHADRAQIFTWNEILCEPALKLIELRTGFLSLIKEQAQQLHQSFALVDGALEIDYLPSVEHQDIDLFRELLNSQFERERLQRKSALGPHLDDFKIQLAGQKARSFASQGQTRSLVLSLKLAALKVVENESGESPIVLLDDVESELDQERRQRLIAYLLGSGYQVFITGTDHPESQFREIESTRIIKIAEGKITNHIK